MSYLDFSDFDWKHTFSQFVVNLIVWSGSAGITGWLIAAVYNDLCDTHVMKLK